MSAFQLDTSLPFAAKINPVLAYQQRQTVVTIYTMAHCLGYLQRLARRNHHRRNTLANQFTFTQQQILGWYAEVANQWPRTARRTRPISDETLKANAGPSWSSGTTPMSN